MSHFHRQPILVPIDYSDSSLHAVRVAKSMAEADAAITVVHVGHEYESITQAHVWGVNTSPRIDLDRQRTRVQEWAKENHLGDVRLVLRQGDPGRQVCELAAEMECKLIIVPSHGRHGLKRVLLGSVAERIIRHSHCSVLVLRREVEQESGGRSAERWCPRKRILVPVDFSESTDFSLHVAKELVDDRADIDVLSAVENLSDAILVGETVVTQDELCANRQEFLERYLAEHGHSGMRAHAIVGDAGISIATYAEKVKADLVVMPSHGYHGLQRLVLGSTTERVIRQCHSPVLVLRRHDAQ